MATFPIRMTRKKKKKKKKRCLVKSTLSRRNELRESDPVLNAICCFLLGYQLDPFAVESQMVKLNCPIMTPVIARDCFLTVAFL